LPQALRNHEEAMIWQTGMPALATGPLPERFALQHTEASFTILKP
jgi:hypothetical protein